MSPIESVRWASGTPSNPRGRKGDFLDYIDSDLQDALGVHEPLVQQFVKWLAMYRAPVKQPPRNHPYEGAANYMLPTIATDADQLFAKFLQTVHAADNLWTLKPLNERWKDATKPLQDLLTWMDGAFLHMYDVNTRVLGEMVKLGTGIYKTGWTYEKRPVWTYDTAGKLVKAEKTVGRPFVDHVRLADFVKPANSYAIDPDAQGGAPWVAERLRVSTARLRWMAESSEPYLPKVDKEILEKIIRFEETGVTEYDAAVQSNDYEKRATVIQPDFESDGDRPRTTSGAIGSSSKYVREVELWEIHARFPTDTNSSQDDVIIWYHRPTRQIVRGVYQYYHHGKRPYEVVRYFPGEGFYGMGVCEQTEVFQNIDSDLFNFTWDNVMLANSRMVVAKSGSNIAPGEPFYPWKVIVTDEDVNKSLGIFPMNDIYPSLPMLSDAASMRKEKRNGMGDLQMGNMQSLPSRTPATTTLSLLQEGARRPDLTIKNMRYTGLSMVGLRLIQLCQQYMGSPVDVGGKNLLGIAVQMLGDPEGAAAAEKLLTPVENAEFGIGCVITATSGSNNKETLKQDYLALLQLSAQMTGQFVQLAQLGTQMAGTPIGDVAVTGFNSLAILYKRLLETYDTRDIEEIVPSTTQGASAGLIGAIPPMAAGAAPGAPAGAEQGAGAGAAAAPIDPSVQALYGGAQQGL